MADVMAFLDGLYNHLQDCQQRAAEFKNYQKQFRVTFFSVHIYFNKLTIF